MLRRFGEVEASSASYSDVNLQKSVTEAASRGCFDMLLKTKNVICIKDSNVIYTVVRDSQDFLILRVALPPLLIVNTYTIHVCRCFALTAPKDFSKFWMQETGLNHELPIRYQVLNKKFVPEVRVVLVENLLTPVYWVHQLVTKIRVIWGYVTVSQNRVTVIYWMQYWVE